jgi:hypothetical protein
MVAQVYRNRQLLRRMQLGAQTGNDDIGQTPLPQPPPF